jgi:hypothetical protein
MRLRVCDGERERVTPATVELVEEAFAPGVAVRDGFEIARILPPAESVDAKRSAVSASSYWRKSAPDPSFTPSAALCPDGL